MKRLMSAVLVILVLAALSTVLMGCAEPRIDTSTPESTSSSIAKVRESLPQDKRADFDSALQVVMMNQVDLGAVLFQAFASATPDVGAYQTKFKNAINGKTGSEIIADAQRIKSDRDAKQTATAVRAKDDQKATDLAKIKLLEQKRSDYQTALQQLKKFEVSRALFYENPDVWGKISNPVIIEVTVRNGTPKAISKVYFTGVLASPGRSVPWFTGDLNYSIPGGLEPGEATTWKLTPNILSDWNKVKAPADAILTVTVKEVDGADGKSLYSTAIFSESDESNLQTLKALYPGQ